MRSRILTALTEHPTAQLPPRQGRAEMVESGQPPGDHPAAQPSRRGAASSAKCTRGPRMRGRAMDDENEMVSTPAGGSFPERAVATPHSGIRVVMELAAGLED